MMQQVGKVIFFHNTSIEFTNRYLCELRREAFNPNLRWYRREKQNLEPESKFCSNKQVMSAMCSTSASASGSSGLTRNVVQSVKTNKMLKKLKSISDLDVETVVANVKRNWFDGSKDNEKGDILCKQCSPGNKLAAYKSPPPWRVFLNNIFGWEVQLNRPKKRSCNYFFSKNQKEIDKVFGKSNLDEKVCKAPIYISIVNADVKRRCNEAKEREFSAKNVNKLSSKIIPKDGLTNEQIKTDKVSIKRFSHGKTSLPIKYEVMELMESVTECCKKVRDRERNLKSQYNIITMHIAGLHSGKKNLEAYHHTISLKNKEAKKINSKNILIDTSANRRDDEKIAHIISEHNKKTMSKDIVQPKLTNNLTDKLLQDKNTSSIMNTSKADSICLRFPEMAFNSFNSLVKRKEDVVPTEKQPNLSTEGTFDCIKRFCGLKSNVKETIAQELKDVLPHPKDLIKTTIHLSETGKINVSPVAVNVTSITIPQIKITEEEKEEELALPLRYTCGAGIIEEQIRNSRKLEPYKVNFRYRDHCKRKPGEEIPEE